jgi:hypothetical protein
MTVAVNAGAKPAPETCYGVDIAEDGALVVAQCLGEKTTAPGRFPPAPEGVAALREHIGTRSTRPRICIRTGSAAALGIAIGLAQLPRVEVTLVAPRAIAASARASRNAAPESSEQRALRLARLAARLV